jgi:hypothetical protein
MRPRSAPRRRERKVPERFVIEHQVPFLDPMTATLAQARRQLHGFNHLRVNVVAAGRKRGEGEV